jgi:hypothetical protein
MSIIDPHDIYRFEVYRLQANDYAVEFATLRSTAISGWLLREHTAWTSRAETTAMPDQGVAFLAGWVAAQYPTLRVEAEEVERDFQKFWGTTLSV